jgi:hypothetical protein
MQKIIIYTVILVVSLLSKVAAQEKKEITIDRAKKIEKRKEELNSRKNKVVPFAKKVEEISIAMEYLLAKEKNNLKVIIDSLENVQSSNEISNEKLKELKQIEAEKSAKKIELGMEIYNSKLDSLIQNKIEIGSKEFISKIDTINGKKVYSVSKKHNTTSVSYTHLRAHETEL